MGKFKPLIASLATIALAMLILFAWSQWRGAPARGNQAANHAPPPANLPDAGLKYEQVVLEDLPQRDPSNLWPQHGHRMSSPEFWVLWKTDDFCDCRLIATKNDRLWYEVGHTGGDTHYLAIDLAQFDSSVTFAVDFTHEGKRYRSRPRSVSFGRGAQFSRRQYNFLVAPLPNQTFGLFMDGRDPIKVPGRGFKHGWFGGDLVVYYSPQPGDEKGGEIIFGVQDGTQIPADGTVGWLEMYDELANTRDRTVIHLKRKPPK
ncbi:MAG: hypothetical protein KF754_05155 [Planctomycetes bacterium]|nr:hypothetical protein [Planctomycetota bacterium]